MIVPLNEEQNVAADAIQGNIVVIAGPGTGKCLGRGTPVLMYDGTIKAVEQIRVGDLLIGPDSNPRLVLQLDKGSEEMFLVEPIKGDSFSCNKAHILSLRMSGNRYKNTEYRELSIRDYLQQSQKFKARAKLWRSAIEWPSCSVSLDPYFLGLWLGDGTSELSCLAVSKPDKEIKQFLDEFAAKNGLVVKNKACDGKCPTWVLSNHRRNDVLKKLQMLFPGRATCDTKHIPHNYKINTRSIRLDLLAGLLDADGHLDRSGVFDFISKSRQLAEDVVFLCRSLGLAAYFSRCVKGIKSCDFTGEYFRVCISGDLSAIPTRIERKRAQSRRQIKNVLKTGFEIRSLGVGDYFGFELDGDGLFLLGDFTVTHNTTVMTNRYVRMVSTHCIPKTDILNLTFTNEAAANMVERIGLSGAKENFKTFHAFALDFLKKERANVPFRLNEEILPCGKDVGLKKALLKVYPAIKSYHELNDRLNQWKASNIKPTQAIAEANEKDLWLAFAYRDYERRCREEGWLDFSSMMDETVSLLEGNDEVRKRWIRKYICVDECQDTDIVQFRLLQLLYGGNIFVVGDENQLIYAWRSAVAGSLTNFQKYFPESSTLYLGANYRSTGAIVDFLKRILPVDNGLASHMRSMREYGEKPTFVKFDSDMHEADGVLSKITDVEHSAVIARTNRQLRTIQQTALSRGIKTEILGQKNLWQKDEVKELMTLAQSMGDFTSPASKVLKNTMEINGLDRKYANTGGPNEKPPIENMLDLIKLASTRGNLLEFGAWFRRLTYAGGKKKEPKLSLTTVNQAKGREWKNVFVIGAKQGMMPHKDGEILEEKRIFFVACSRAADRLQISYDGNLTEFLSEFKDEAKYEGNLEVSRGERDFPSPAVSSVHRDPFSD